jgi:alpha-amylase
LALLAATASTADVNGWKKRAVYQLLTDRFWRSSGDTSLCDLHNYCGGNFDGVTAQLQYIKDLGFDAIWISPVLDNTEGGYHGYWARNWEKTNSHFGDDAALKRLVDKAHSMDIWVMVDVVANHVGPVEHDYSSIYPFNRPEHYHSDCDINDWGNQWQVENCRLARLPDLDQGNSYVRQYLKDWIKNLVQKFNFDGIRIDTIPEVPKDFWREFGASAGVFQMGENFNGNDAYVGDYQNYVTGLFNYPMYYSIRDVWMYGRSMRTISDRWATNMQHFKDVDALGIFVDNHDNSRFLHSNGDQRLFKSALAFSLTARGIPFYYYGSEQGFGGGNDPENREVLWRNFDKNHDIYTFTQTINRARTAQQIWNNQFQEKWADDTLYAFTRGKFFVALTNNVNGQVH